MKNSDPHKKKKCVTGYKITRENTLFTISTQAKQIL